MGNILSLWNTGETARPDVMGMQLQSATENVLNYLRATTARVSSSFRQCAGRAPPKTPKKTPRGVRPFFTCALCSSCHQTGLVPNAWSGTSLGSCAFSPWPKKTPGPTGISRADSRIYICSNMQSHLSALWGSCSIIGDMPSKVGMKQIRLCSCVCDLGTGVTCGAARTSETHHWLNFLLYFMQQGQSLFQPLHQRPP